VDATAAMMRAWAMNPERLPSGLRSVLALPAYRRLWTAQTVSRAGDVFNTVALAVLVFQLTGSGLGVTGVVVAEILPVLALAPLAGGLVAGIGVTPAFLLNAATYAFRALRGPRRRRRRPGERPVLPRRGLRAD